MDTSTGKASDPLSTSEGAWAGPVDTRSVLTPAEVADYFSSVGGDAAGERRERTPEERLESAGFPAVTVDALGYLTRPMPDAVREWAEGYRGRGTPWLWVKGATGRGKTCAAAWAAAEVMRRMDAGEVRPSSVTFVQADRLTELYGEAPRFRDGKSARTKLDTIGDVSGAGLLVLDDLGSEVRFRVPFEAVGHVIKDRHDAMLPTIVTTQYGATDFMGKWLGRGATEEDAEATVGRMLAALAGWPHGATGEEINAAILSHVVEMGGGDMRRGA